MQNALLERLPRAALTRLIGDRWRLPLVRFASSPMVYALPGDTVVLCGCYKLETVKRFVRAVGPTGRIIAIEANPDSVARLERALSQDAELRQGGNVTLVAKGVWDKTDQLTFLANVGEARGYDKIRDETLREYEPDRLDGVVEQSIAVDTIDNILAAAGVRKVDLVVLTVNNAELPALAGMQRTIGNNPRLRLYIHSVSPYPLEQVKESLGRHGFRFRAEPVSPNSRLHRIYAFDSAGAGRV